MATQLGVGFGVEEEAKPEVEPATAPAEPPDDGWNAEDADTVTTTAASPVPTPAPTPVAAVPVVATPTPKPVGAAMLPRKAPVSPARRDAEQTSPQPALTMSTGMREEVWAIVRAAVSDAIAPFVARTKELEDRLAKAERALEQERESRLDLVAKAQAAVAAATQASAMSSIPVAIGPSVAPAAIAAAALAAPKAPRFEAPSPVVVAAPVRVPGGSMPPTGLGVVVTEGPKRTLDLPAPHTVTEIELPDFGRGRRRMGRVVVALMLLGVVAAIVATILSRV